LQKEMATATKNGERLPDRIHCNCCKRKRVGGVLWHQWGKGLQVADRKKIGTWSLRRSTQVENFQEKRLKVARLVAKKWGGELVIGHKY